MNEKIKLTEMRINYTSALFDETHVPKNPIDQFEIWFNEAVNVKIEELNAMTLSTVSTEGYPNARVVLLKEFDKKGFVFYTNYESKKGKEIENNDAVVLLFFWKELARQVRIKGKVEKVSREESNEYFHSRPRESQLGAWASKQSSEIPDRKFLEDKFQSLQKEYDGKEIPLPSFWGGYRVIPFEVEFWQGRENRLHDRILYLLIENDWQISRLSP
jgi:pyridoxamine 5'-phosphate oxidase